MTLVPIKQGLSIVETRINHLSYQCEMSDDNVKAVMLLSTPSVRHSNIRHWSSEIMNGTLPPTSS